MSAKLLSDRQQANTCASSEHEFAQHSFRGLRTDIRALSEKARIDKATDAREGNLINRHTNAAAMILKILRDEAPRVVSGNRNYGS